MYSPKSRLQSEIIRIKTTIDVEIEKYGSLLAGADYLFSRTDVLSKTDELILSDMMLVLSNFEHQTKLALDNLKELKLCKKEINETTGA